MVSTRSKYFPLYEHLRARPLTEWTASFAEIEEILGIPLPPSARKHSAWWSNSRVGHDYAQSWLDAGFDTRRRDFVNEHVTFVPQAAVDLPIEPEVGRRHYLIKVNPEGCPDQDGDPATATVWENGEFLVSPPRGSMDGQPLPPEQSEPPTEGDPVMVWVNGAQGENGLAAIGRVAHYLPISDDTAKIRLTGVQKLHGRRVDSDILAEFHGRDEFLDEIKRDRTSKLRWVSEEMWIHLLVVRETLNVRTRRSDAVRIGLARVLTNILSRTWASGRSVVRVAPIRTTLPPKELEALLDRMWEEQQGLCGLCHQAIDEESGNPMLRMSPDRIDSADPRYVGESFHLTHQACNLAKNAATTDQFDEWLLMVRQPSASTP